MRKEIPILFSDAMVKAVAEDRKTKTRRIIKELIIDKECGFAFYKNAQMDIHNWEEEIFQYCPYGVPTDLLYVRETHYMWGKWIIEGLTKTGKVKKKFIQTDKDVLFEKTVNAMGETFNLDLQKTKYSEGWFKRLARFMFKKHARYWLEIVSIKIERLHDISLEDIQAEGVTINLSEDNKVQWGPVTENCALSFLNLNTKGKTEGEWEWYDVYFAHWAALWCKINGRESWDSNPWVWVVEFKKIKK